MLIHFLLVALGGAIGSTLRHGAGLLALRYLDDGYPWATLSVNLLGSLLIGIITGCLAFFTTWSHEAKLLLVVGVLGGFTTFSAFSLDALLLIERGQTGAAFLYISTSVLGALAATALGLWIVRALSL